MQVIPFRSCGWCLTDMCDKCLPELEFFGRLFVCACKECKVGYVPVHLRGVRDVEESEE